MSMRTSMWRWRSLAAALSVVACGSSPAKKANDPGFCRLTTGVNVAEKPGEHALPTDYWFSLLVRGYQVTGAVPRPVTDCAGQAVAWTADRCGEPPPQALPPRPLGKKDLVVSPLPNDSKRKLVWVVVDKLVDGQGQGPVALAEFDERGVVVRRLGVLRAYHQQAQLRIEKLGEGEVLVAEGDACDVDRDAGSCRHAIRVLPMGARLFYPRDVIDADGRCAGDSLFVLRRDGFVDAKGGRKIYALRSSLQFAPEAFTVQEQIEISAVEGGESSIDAAATSVGRMRADRRVTLRGGNLVSTGPALLEKFLRPRAD